MNTMNIPDVLTIEQIIYLKNKLKNNTTKKQLTSASVKRYFHSDKGKIARKAASAKYYRKKKKQKTINAMEDELKKMEAHIAALKSKLLEQSK